MSYYAAAIHGDQNVQVPAHLCFGKYMLDRLRLFGRNIALENPETDEKLTYEELTQYAVNLSISLTKMGVGVGDVVGLGSEKRLEYIPTALAVVLTGATQTPYDLKTGRVILKHKLSIAKPTYFICTKLFWETYKDILRTFDCIKCYISLDGTIDSLIPVKSLLTNVVDVKQFEPTRVRGQSDVAFILYSSGTTGMPKGVQLTHLNCILRTLPQNFSESSLETAYINAVWKHNYDTFMTCKFLYMGKKIVFVNKLTLPGILKCIHESKVNVAMLIPLFVLFLSKAEDLNKYSLDSLKVIYSRTSPLHTKALENIKKRFPKLQYVLQGYGLTECGEPLSDSWVTKGPKSGSVGMASPGVIIKIVDPLTNKTLGPNEHGEIRLSGPLLMKGYIGIDPSTYLDEQGFFKTGDLGYYDEDNYFYIIDRLKDLIIYDGFKIFPLEIESVLLTHPKVREAAVVGKPVPLLGEAPTAFVVIEPGADVTEKELTDYVAYEVAPFMKLAGGVRFLNEMPKNNTGKILRRNLRELLNEKAVS